MNVLRYNGGVLYHGSARLYSIQCYIRRSKPFLERYLFDLQGRLPVRLAPDYEEWLMGVRKILSRGDVIFPARENPYLSWTVDVTLLRILEEMYTTLGYTLKLSTILATNFSTSDFLSLSKLLTKIRIIENYEYVDQLEVDYPLDPQYFSVMRMPVQFFGSRNTALRYGKGENQLYVYQPSRPLMLLNLDNQYNIEKLITENAPFASFSPHSESVIRHHVEISLEIYRAKALTYHLLRLYNKDERTHDVIRRREERILVVNSRYQWLRYREASKMTLDQRWDVLLGGQTYDQMLREELDTAQRERLSTVYQWLVNKYGSNDNAVISQRIREEFPAPTLRIDLTFEGYLNDQIDVIHEDTDLKIGRWLQDAVHNGDNFLGANLGINFAQVWVELSVLYSRDLHQILYRGLGLKYFDYFTTEIASPRGDWTISRWEYLFPSFEEVKTRFSTYLQDTMIVYNLIHSAFFKDNDLDGWMCDNRAEVMVHQPSRKGEMKKVTTVYNTDRCLYSGAETEENFLDEYS